MSNSIVQQEAQPLAVPDYIKALVTTGQHKSDFGTIDNSDIGVGFLKLVSVQSKEFKPNWGGRNEQPLPLNTMFLSRDHKIIPPGTPFIPLIRKVTYIYWEGRPGNGRMIFSTDDANDPRIVKIKGLEFRKDERTGKQSPPLVTRYTNYYIITPFNPDEPVVMSFYRTSLTIGRRFTQDLIRATHGGDLPLYALTYTLGVPFVKRDGQNEWPQLNIEPCGFTDPKIIDKAKKGAEAAHFLAQTFGATEAASLDEGLDEEAGVETLDAQPVQATPAPAPAAPPVTPAAPAQTPPQAPPIQAQPTKALW